MFFIWLDRNSSANLAAAKAKNQPSSPAAQASPGPVSEHNWAKHSLDRARAVSDQAREKRQEDDQP
jgi:hypothetical protein